ncbi:hypothetical protein JB92DRAFT_2881759 [Gautieria morchelliformis]|nr:hypothetical protein JB92DRAFT_2881759 [Gautieria morchelliformis]
MTLMLVHPLFCRWLRSSKGMTAACLLILGRVVGYDLFSTFRILWSEGEGNLGIVIRRVSMLEQSI